MIFLYKKETKKREKNNINYKYIKLVKLVDGLKRKNKLLHLIWHVKSLFHVSHLSTYIHHVRYVYKVVMRAKKKMLWEKFTAKMLCDNNSDTIPY